MVPVSKVRVRVRVWVWVWVSVRVRVRVRVRARARARAGVRVGIRIRIRARVRVRVWAELDLAKRAAAVESPGPHVPPLPRRRVAALGAAIVRHVGVPLRGVHGGGVAHLPRMLVAIRHVPPLRLLSAPGDAELLLRRDRVSSRRAQHAPTWLG